MPTTPRIRVLQTGGTIGSAGSGPADRIDYVDLARLLTDEEARSFYRFPEHLDVDVQRLASMRSNDADETFYRRAYTAVAEAVADPAVDGVVLAHGTATLEETAYLLQLTLSTEKPVVITGAQRPPTADGSDAPVNLYNAVLVAAAESAAGQGVLVVMDDEILSARDVTKAENSRLHAFQARCHGPLGDVDAYGAVHLERGLKRRHTAWSEFAGNDLSAPLPRVEVLALYSGVDRAVIDDAVRRGCAGLVIASLAPSLNPSAIDAAIDDAVNAGVTVVQASRGNGRVLQRPSFTERSLIAAGTLSPQAARILLLLCLLSGFDVSRTASAFRTH